MESEPIAFKLKPLDIVSFLGNAINLNTPYGEKFSVHFQLKHPIPDIRVQADADRLLQVITNLMSNAAKFSPQGGVVDIAAELRETMLRISVSDHGPGIAAEFHERIFHRFEQADSSDTRQKGGTGLGLSICKAIIDKMGGRIGFDSIPGQGATFYFELPTA